MSCSHSNASIFSICPTCGEIVTPPDLTDPFSLLNIEPRFFVDVQALQERFYNISRKLHPDRFQKGEPQLLGQATQLFAVINKAYSQLRSENERARALFDLAGYKVPADKNNLPADLAEDYFDLQEAIEDRRGRYSQFLQALSDRIASVDREKNQAFKDWESAGAPLSHTAFPYFERAARQMSLRSYLTSMALDLDKKLEEEK